MTSNFSTRIIFTVLSLIGFALLPLLSIQLLPTTKKYQLTINYQWPNTAPAVVEQTVTTPLEGAFNLVRGVKKITSVSRQGQGYIQLDLAKQVDLPTLRFKIANKIRQLYPQLPKGVSYPTIDLNNPDETQAKRPILTYSLSGNDPPTALYRYAQETLSPQLALTAGMQRISVIGGQEMLWEISYDAAQCALLGIRRSDLRRALGRHFERSALGTVEDRELRFFVRLENGGSGVDWGGGTVNPPPGPLQRGKAPELFENLREKLGRNKIMVQNLKNIPIKKVGQQIVRLGEIARVQLRPETPQQHYRINGQNSVRLLFFAEQGVNTLRLGQTIKEQISTLRSTLPSDYQLFLDKDGYTSNVVKYCFSTP
ncbi:MAG: efflux RND transporter permease subunit [Bacteroidota bacterium]